MKYGFREDQVNTGGPKFPIGPAIDNVILEKVEYVSGQDKNGSSFEAVDFYYQREDEAGVEQKIKDRLFTVNESTLQPKPNMTLEDVTKKAYEVFNTKLLRVAEACNIGREEVQEQCANSSTFRELIETYAEIINSRAKGNFFWLKTLPDNNGYTRVAAFTDFIQNMSESTCRLMYTKYEQDKIANMRTAPAAGVHEEAGAPGTDWSNVSESKF